MPQAANSPSYINKSFCNVKSSLCPLGASRTSPPTAWIFVFPTYWYKLLYSVADIHLDFLSFVTLHNSFLKMIIKIVKVFVCQSLDYFSTLCYNMIDVKIGLAAERFGQFGEARQMRQIRGFTCFTRKFLSEAVWSAQTISGEPVCTGLAICGRALSICFRHGYFCILPYERNYAHDTVYKRLLV